MRIIAVVLLYLVLVGCGKDSKGLFSSWRGESSGLIIDLTSGKFGSFPMAWVFTSGAICDSTILLSGDEEAGSAAITSATYRSGGSGDPGCSSLNGSYNYTLEDSKLRICPQATPTTCNTYI